MKTRNARTSVFTPVLVESQRPELGMVVIPALEIGVRKSEVQGPASTTAWVTGDTLKKKKESGKKS